MEKIKMLLRKIKKSYRKLKYLDKTQATYFIVSSFLLMFFTFVGGTYSYFTITERLAATTITIAKLKYELTSTNTKFKNNSITVSKGEGISLELELKSLNEFNTKYALDYICNNPDVKVYYEEKQEQNVEGTIGSLNSELTIKIYIVNNSSTSQTINLKLNGGYLNNELHSNIVEKKKVISEMIARQNVLSTELIWGHKSDIKKIVFEDILNPKDDATYTYDISSKQNGSVMSYLVSDSTDNSKYTLYIQFDGELFANKNSSGLFYGFTNLESIENLNDLNTTNVTTMNSMFYECSSLSSIDLSNFDTSNVTYMSNIFYGCKSLTELDLSSFNTSNVTSMSGMFESCSGLTALNVSNFDTSNVTSMSMMFSFCKSLTELDLSSFNTSNITSMSGMFESCSGLTALNVSNFDTSNVTRMNSMFSFCKSLTRLDVSNFDTNNVADMNSMFAHCSSLTTLDLSNFDTSNVTDMGSMFQSCSSLTTLDLSNFDTSNVTSMIFMFANSSSLTATIEIIGTNCISYTCMFLAAASSVNAQITVRYTEDASSLVDNMIATKSHNNSKVVKASQPEPEYLITINGNYDVTLSSNQAYHHKEITLSSNQEIYIVSSFKVDGELIQGHSFKMPNGNVVISDIVLREVTIVESEHNPYPNSLNNKEYLNKTFEGATSLTVVLEYQTEGTSYDYIYLYDKDNTRYGKYGGDKQTTEIITIPGDTLRIVFRTDSSDNNYYGFKAMITPNYN